MKHFIRVLAVIGAISVLLISYSALRSPQGTLQTIVVIAAWWIDPLILEKDDSPELFPDIISNPERTEVAGIALGSDYRLTIQDEVYANFLGDGHCIVIAKWGSESDTRFPPSSIAWTPLAQSETELLHFLRETTPYAKHSGDIDPLLDDPDALISIRNLNRNGDSISNLRIFLVSPHHRTLLEWESNF